MAKVLRWERRPDDRPKEILDAALRVFAARGYRATRLEEIGEAAGVTKGTIYHYFTNKEELLLRAIEHYHDQAFGRLGEMLRGMNAPATDRIRQLLRRWFGPVGGERMAIRKLLVQGVAHEAPEAYRRWLAGGPVAAAQLLASFVKEGQASGEFRRDADAEAVSRTMVAGLLLQSVWEQHAAEAPEVGFDQERLLESAMEFFLHGLRAN